MTSATVRSERHKRRPFRHMRMGPAAVAFRPVRAGWGLMASIPNGEYFLPEHNDGGPATYVTDPPSCVGLAVG